MRGGPPRGSRGPASEVLGFSYGSLWRCVVAKKVTFLYAGIRVRNLAKSLRFYRRIGFRVMHRGRMSHGGVWVQLRFPGAQQRIELNYYPRGNPYYTPIRAGTEFDHFGFRALDVDGWEAKLRRMRMPIVARIRHAPYENIVYTRDPDGNWLEFFGPYREPKSPS